MQDDLEDKSKGQKRAESVRSKARSRCDDHVTEAAVPLSSPSVPAAFADIYVMAVGEGLIKYSVARSTLHSPTPSSSFGLPLPPPAAIFPSLLHSPFSSSPSFSSCFLLLICFEVQVFRRQTTTKLKGNHSL